MAMQPEPVGPAQGPFFGPAQRRASPGWHGPEEQVSRHGMARSSTEGPLAARPTTDRPPPRAPVYISGEHRLSRSALAQSPTPQSALNPNPNPHSLVAAQSLLSLARIGRIHDLANLSSLS